VSRQLALYDRVVCLDGSDSDETERIATAFSDRLIYLHERDFDIPHKTDHGLRGVVHREIVRRFGTEHWVMCCHADEFCYHDPRKIAELAAARGFDLVSWFSPHFYPHPSELPDWKERRHLPISERFRHYHWSFKGDGYPWAEDRLYRNGPNVSWNDRTHGSVRPTGLKRKAPFYPILRHYKVYRIDPCDFEVNNGSSFYRRHWTGQLDRTGVAFEVEQPEDLFVDSVPKYTRCDRYDGTFPHNWNLGDEYRPDASVPRSASNRHDVLPSNRMAALPLRRLVLRDRVAAVPFSARGPDDEAIRQDVWDRDVYRVREIDLAPKTVIDVGAKIGAFAVLAAELWPEARIIACEPDPGHVEFLRRHLGDRPNVTIISVAVVGEDNPTELKLPTVIGKGDGGSGGRSAHSGGDTSVPAVSALKLWRDHCPDGCDLVKLDDDGTQLGILKAWASAGVLRRVRRIVGMLRVSGSGAAEMRHQLSDVLSPTHRLMVAALPRSCEAVYVADVIEGDDCTHR
jgi:FkbM family methyltransferase